MEQMQEVAFREQLRRPPRNDCIFVSTFHSHNFVVGDQVADIEFYQANQAMALKLFLLDRVTEWEKREIIKASGDLQNHPSVLKYILGRKDSRPTLKVFLQDCNERTEQFLKMQGKKLSNETNYEFVHVNEKLDDMWKEVKEIERIERSAPKIPSSTKLVLNEIVNTEGEKIYAKYSNIVGIGVSNVLGKQKKTPCIVLYCLDKNIIPFGESALPSYLKEYPCDIREDLITFGSCENCHSLNPGCDIGSPFFAGSAGFLVESASCVKKFLTAAHVVVRNCGDIYQPNSDDVTKIRCSPENTCIMHPSNSSNNVGTVENCIFGNYWSYGSDVAIVRMNTSTEQECRPLPTAESETDYEYLKVTKKGKITGVTFGIIHEVVTSARIDSITDTEFGHFYTFNNCYCVRDVQNERPFFKIGDSGSGVLLVDEHNRRIVPLGIAFARGRFNFSTYVCKIKHIAEQFQLKIYQDAFSSSILQRMNDEEPMDIQ